jgi:hypothetical protein
MPGFRLELDDALALKNPEFGHRRDLGSLHAIFSPTQDKTRPLFRMRRRCAIFKRPAILPGKLQTCSKTTQCVINRSVGTG